MAKKAKKTKKIIRYKKTININIGTIIFLFIFVYLVIIVFNYFSKDKIHIYEVVEGSLASNSYYTGLILRNEEIYTAEQAGYVNFYMKQGDRTGNGNLICLLDESGDITSKLSENSEDANNLSMENLGSLRKQLTEYSTGYDPMEFDAIYDVKYKLQSMLWEYVSAQALEELQNAAAESGSHFQLNYAPKSGILEYYTDGFETLTPEQITADHFKASDYKKNYIKSGDMVEAGSPIYKLIGSDEWSLILPISEEDVLAFADKTSLRVRFIGYDLELRAAYSTFIGADAGTYARLDFQKYMVDFSDERFVEVEIGKEQEEGLKIPKTSVVQKDFYVIPVSFLTTGENNKSGFYREIYLESGPSVEFISPSIYQQTAEYCYVDKQDLNSGDYIIMPDSNERYQVGASSGLSGVYNVNKGYAVFKQIEIIDENAEYYIVKKGTSFGLSAFDHIVLEGSMIREEDIIY